MKELRYSTKARKDLKKYRNNSRKNAKTIRTIEFAY